MADGLYYSTRRRVPASVLYLADFRRMYASRRCSFSLIHKVCPSILRANIDSNLFLLKCFNIHCLDIVKFLSSSSSDSTSPFFIIVFPFLLIYISKAYLHRTLLLHWQFLREIDLQQLVESNRNYSASLNMLLALRRAGTPSRTARSSLGPDTDEKPQRRI